MAVLEIVDRCLAPERDVIMNYSGPDPWGVAKKISGSIREYFHVSASGTSQTIVNWDISGDPIKFYSTWWVRKKFSRFSVMKVDILVQGTKSKTTNRGDFRLLLRGDLETKFEGNNIFLKTVWVLYSYLFYNRTRRAFIESCRDAIIGFRNEIKEHFNLKTGPTEFLRGGTG